MVIEERSLGVQENPCINGKRLDWERVLGDGNIQNPYLRNNSRFQLAIPLGTSNTTALQEFEALATPTEIQFYGVRLQYPYFGASITVEDGKRILSFQAFLKTPDGRRIEGLPSGSEFTRSALEFFERRGRVDRIESTWMEGADTYKAVAASERAFPQRPLREHIPASWGYANARRLGFTNVGEPERITEKGKPGIRVRFGR